VGSAAYTICTNCIEYVGTGTGLNKLTVLTGASNAPTFTGAAFATGDAVVFNLYCHPSSGTITSISLAASGWTFFQLPNAVLTNNGAAGYSSTFGAIAPNTSTATFTATFTGAANCSDYASFIGVEVSKNNTTGGATTFTASASSAAGTGGCNQTAANITPTVNNEFVGFFCFNASGVNSPWLQAVNNGTNDFTAYQIFVGNPGAQTPGFAGSTAAYTVVGVAIAPAVSSTTLSVIILAQ
jgi:hypothetical protein